MIINQLFRLKYGNNICRILWFIFKEKLWGILLTIQLRKQAKIFSIKIFNDFFKIISTNFKVCKYVLIHTNENKKRLNNIVSKSYITRDKGPNKYINIKIIHLWNMTLHFKIICILELYIPLYRRDRFHFIISSVL